MLHYLSCAGQLVLHFKELCVFQQSERLLLLGYFDEASLNEFPRLRNVAHLVLSAGSNEPDLPLEVVRAVDDSLHHVFAGGTLLIEAFVSLRSLDVDLPGKLAIDLVKHLIDHTVKLGAALLLEEPQILEPERPILRIVL